MLYNKTPQISSISSSPAMKCFISAFTESSPQAISMRLTCLYSWCLLASCLGAFEFSYIFKIS